MADFMINTETMTNIADKVRQLDKSTESLFVDDMIDKLETENTNVQNGLNAIANKGVSVPSDASSKDLSNLIGEISTSVDLPTLSNPGTSSDMLSGKELIDQNGNIITGTIESKDASDLTANGATITVPAGHYASQVSKSVNTVTQATPSVSISSSGLITASATQSEGYVSAGTKSGTKQLTTQAAKTITPSTSSQTAVAKDVYTTGAVTVAAIPSTYVKPTATKAATTYTPTTSNQTIAAGTYCSGAQTIVGDANLVAENIAEGVSIFGVTGTHSGGSGESSGSGGSVETCTVTFSVGQVYAYNEVDDYWDMMPGAIRVMGVTVENNEITLRNHMTGSVISNGTTLEVAKNSMLAFIPKNTSSDTYASSITVSADIPSYVTGAIVYGVSFLITNDCTISVAFD